MNHCRLTAGYSKTEYQCSTPQPSRNKILSVSSGGGEVAERGAVQRGHGGRVG